MPEQEITQSESVTPKRNLMDYSKALKLRLLNGLSYNEIAKACGVHKSTVVNGLKPFLSLLRNPQAREAYKANKSDLLTAAEMHIVGKIANPQAIKKASINNLAYAANTLYNMNRLEQDLSTNNVSVMHATDYTKDIEALDAEYEELSNQ